MPANAKSQVFFWLMVLMIVGAVGGVLYMGMDRGLAGGSGTKTLRAVVTGRPLVNAPPRTLEPAGEYTRFFEKKSLRVNSGLVDLHLPYYWFAPSKPWPQGLRFPLVMVLHGAPGNAYAAQYLIQRDMQIHYPAFIFVPVLPNGMTWYEPASTPQGSAHDKERPKGLPGAMQALAQIVRDYPVDISRIYVIGCSEGGVGAFGAIKEYGELFAAAVAISGGWAPQQAGFLKKAPMLVMHGAQDTVIPPERSRDVSALARKMGAPLEYVEFPQMSHNCPAPELYSPSVWRWMFGKKKSLATPPAAATP